jgi:hypothetical protein
MSALKQDKDIQTLPSEATKDLLASLFAIRKKRGTPISSSHIIEDEIEFYSDYKMSEYLHDIYICKGKISLPLHFYCDQENCSWVIYQTGVGEYKAKYYGTKENIFSRVNNDKKLSLTFLNIRGLHSWIQHMINEWGIEGNERYMLKCIGSSSCKMYRIGNKSQIQVDIVYFIDTYLSNILISN